MKRASTQDIVKELSELLPIKTASTSEHKILLICIYLNYLSNKIDIKAMYKELSMLLSKTNKNTPIEELIPTTTTKINKKNAWKNPAKNIPKPAASITLPTKTLNQIFDISKEIYKEHITINNGQVSINTTLLAFLLYHDKIKIRDHEGIKGNPPEQYMNLPKNIILKTALQILYKYNLISKEQLNDKTTYKRAAFSLPLSNKLYFFYIDTLSIFHSINLLIKNLSK